MLYNLRVLSPLHIGEGSDQYYTKAELIFKGDFAILLDYGKIIRTLEERGGVELLLEYLEELREKLLSGQRLEEAVRELAEEYEINVEEFAERKIRVHGEISGNFIYKYFRSTGRAIIPGTSMKGAIRTAVLYKVLKEADMGLVRRTLSGIESRELAKAMRDARDLLDVYLNLASEFHQMKKEKADDALEALVFGVERWNRFPHFRYEPKKDPLRFLHVLDSDPFPEESLSFVTTYDISTGRPTIPVPMEILEPGSETRMEIAIKEKELKISWNELTGVLKELIGDPGNFEEFIWNAVREYYSDLIGEELVRYPGRSDVSEFYRGLKKQEGRVLRLGRGKGWISNTVGMLLKRKKDLAERLLARMGITRDLSTFPKTRRCAKLEGKWMPMGWITLREVE